MSWQLDLKRALIRAGTVGLKQTEMLLMFRAHTRTDELTDLLETWRQRKWVQKFKKSGKGRALTIWRATTRILEDQEK